ncbi:hypothetical protein J9303_00815 [Bacillaceae bacterium Marseille-Q3522]|nr:hypothetical protein [Bacillaceae bacterium Marseille-Q3522]
MKILKQKRFAIPIAIILVLLIYGTGYNGGYDKGYAEKTAKIEDETITYGELVEKVNTTQTEYDNKMQQLQEQYADRKAEMEEAAALADQKDQLTDDLIKSQSDLNAVNSDLEAARAELASVQGQIIEKKEAPIQLSAGIFYAAKDFPVGRYKAVPVGEGSNFVVRDAEGYLIVNTVLGENGEPEYIFDVPLGGVIDTRTAVKLIPVE